ncbi:MAG TPA: DUF6456 domain-containing protein [Caulobacterales bacterium]|nr:DUF6456 domain-containing protein [Caulobacterales bacterium]
MSEARLLARLARPGAILKPDRDGGGYGLYASADRRRRPIARVPRARVEALAADGALSALDGGAFALSAAGRARAERAAAAPDEAWRAQHDELVDRPAVDRDGDLYAVRGVRAGGAMARLARLQTPAGAAFFSADEIAAGARLAQDWAAGQEGLLRGADWSAPPRGNTPRGAGGGVELARASAIDARARVDAALAALTPGAAALVRAACLDQTGLEIIERRAHWPARSAKVALKFALAHLAQVYRAGKARG